MCSALWSWPLLSFVPYVLSRWKNVPVPSCPTRHGHRKTPLPLFSPHNVRGPRRSNGFRHLMLALHCLKLDAWGASLIGYALDRSRSTSGRRHGAPGRSCSPLRRLPGAVFLYNGGSTLAALSARLPERPFLFAQPFGTRFLVGSKRVPVSKYSEPLAERAALITGRTTQKVRKAAREISRELSAPSGRLDRPLSECQVCRPALGDAWATSEPPTASHVGGLRNDT